MSNFKKYHSITNSYQEKTIQKFLDEFPELKDAIYIIQEKLYGANIQLYFTPNQEMKVGGRKKWVDSHFYDTTEVIKKYDELTKHFQDISNQTNQRIRLYGEFFGAKILKGVNYGKEKQLLFYDIEINDILQSPHFFEVNVLEKWHVPFIDRVIGLEEALKYNVEFDSKILNIKDNICEGVVIKPYNKVYVSNGGSTFSLKKKNEKFLEKCKAPKIKVEDPVVNKWNNKFREYINDNRVQSMFSKEGEIKEIKQLGEYIKLVLEDAKEDFIKENDLNSKELDKTQIRQVYNVGSTIADLLKGYL